MLGSINLFTWFFLALISPAYHQNETMRSKMAGNKFVFKTTALLSLQAPAKGKREYFYDVKTEGLELSITAAGVKTFNAYKWVNGRARRLTLGRFNPNVMQCPEFETNPLIVLGNNPGLGLEHARTLCRAVLAHWASGQNPIERRRSSRDRKTFGELFEAYIDGHASHRNKTWKVMVYFFNKYFEHWRRRPVKEISRTDVQALVNELGSTSGHSTANRALELVRAVINKAIEWGLVELNNPAAKISKFNIKPRKRFVKADELPKLMKAIEAESNEDIRDYVLMSLSTGVRKNNVLSMRWEHVDLVNGIWTIPDTKNNESHEILLTPTELSILQNRCDNRASDVWVFPGKGTLGYLRDPKKGWIRILKRAEIKDLHLHDLRRSLGSYMAMTGASLSVIGNALNHKDVSTTRKVYAHSAREAEKQARMNAHQLMFPAAVCNRSDSNVISSNVAADEKDSNRSCFPKKSVEF